MSLDFQSYKLLKTALWPIRDQIKWNHLDQGLARGFGFPDSYGLQLALKSPSPDDRTVLPVVRFDVEAFLKRMNELGYRPEPDYRDPHASLWAVAVTALSIIEPTRFLEVLKRTSLSGPIVRLDVTSGDWKKQVEGYRDALTRHWGIGTPGYRDTANGKPWVTWKVGMPLRWKRGVELEIDNSLVEVGQGGNFSRKLDESDAARIRAIKAETGESPDEFFSRILTDLRPYFPGLEDNDIDPIEDVTFSEAGLMVHCSLDNRRTLGMGCSLHFEKIPFRHLRSVA
ncbi:hypothetical protein [Ruegeria profundi]|uniref:Uncharacterized protein n=1 Tax=Ruegeria profundi TaxID=1685378 RepID=A0A0X3TZN4_9RHOB|nr:hypothetical protein [Ruegeria profundi]KUJ78840.1 hypothetical protein AVO44_10625 [Ruegeria profundi]